MCLLIIYHAYDGTSRWYSIKRSRLVVVYNMCLPINVIFLLQEYYYQFHLDWLGNHTLTNMPHAAVYNKRDLAVMGDFIYSEV